MGWKDSGDSVVYPDGSLVKGPKALCELQGYVYAAWVRMAEVFDALDKPERAQVFRTKARALFARSNEALWDEELGFYAYALGTFNDMGDDDPETTFGHVAEKLKGGALAYLHIVNPAVAAEHCTAGQ